MGFAAGCGESGRWSRMRTAHREVFGEMNRANQPIGDTWRTVMNASLRPRRIAVIVLFLAVLCVMQVHAQENPRHIPLPQGGGVPDPGTLSMPSDVTMSLQILFLMTFLTLLPSVVLMMTSFVRISIVLGLLRRAIGTQQSPSNQVLLGMSLFLTIFVMAPTIQKINEQAIQPYLEDPENLRLHAGELDEYGERAPADVMPFVMMLRRSLLPIREFMWMQVNQGDGHKDVALFLRVADYGKPNDEKDVPTHVLIPAFMISELKKAFVMGFLLFIPFMVVDIVVASILISMGMFQLPPAFLSLPFKILLFVLVDGWSLVIESLGMSFKG